jgi:hypothetical protein
MSKLDQFKSEVESGYAFQGESVVLGAAMFDRKINSGLLVKMPLKCLTATD